MASVTICQYHQCDQYDDASTTSMISMMTIPFTAMSDGQYDDMSVSPVSPVWRCQYYQYDLHDDDTIYCQCDDLSI